MTMINNLKALLNTTDETILNILIEQATQEVINYCNVEALPTGLSPVVEEIVMIKWNKRHAQGLSSQSANGVSESYLDGLPKSTIQQLNRYRRLKVI